LAADDAAAEGADAAAAPAAAADDAADAPGAADAARALPPEVSREGSRGISVLLSMRHADPPSCCSPLLSGRTRT